MPAMVSTTRPTTSPPLTAMSDALTASVLAWRALSAFCFTMLVSSSMLEAVSSSELACSSVRCDRSMLPAAICLVALAIESLPPRIVSMVRISPRCMSCRPRVSAPISSWLVTVIGSVRLPREISPKLPSMRFSGTEIARSRPNAQATAERIPTTMAPMISHRKFCERATAPS